MKKILYIPLDERPCNYYYPQYISSTRDDVTLIIPPLELLGNKKEPAKVDCLWEFVFENANTVDAIVLSVEMLVYGGLLPSRLHHLTKEDVKQRINNLEKLREKNDKTPIYAFNLIMRTPNLNTSDEEPDYYEDYGERIFQRAYLLDKKERIGLLNQEEQHLSEISIPKEFIEDYETRRQFNVEVNMLILDLVEKNIINFLSIPQDDSSEYGYTAMDQKKVYSNIRKKRLESKVMVYPGADEVGSTLVARALNNLMNRKLKVYPIFSSTFGPFITPLFEDRPIKESLKAHLLAANCMWAEDAQNADFILAINSPGKMMQEGYEQNNKDVTYNSFRQLQFFVDEIKSYIEKEIPVVLADSAFANGGEIELIEELDMNEILDKLISYKGWNTNCNTMGTSIAAGVFGFEKLEKPTIKKNVVYHLLDDCFYQSEIRNNITKEVLPSLGANYFDLNEKEDIVTQEISQRLQKMYQDLIRQSFKEVNLDNMKVFSPWKRMFEISIEF